MSKKGTTKKNPAKGPAKRAYSTDVRQKIANGEKWRLPLVIDDDNANNILAEIENSLTGGEYNKVINGIIRRHYEKKK